MLGRASIPSYTERFCLSPLALERCRFGVDRTHGGRLALFSFRRAIGSVVGSARKRKRGAVVVVVHVR